MGTTSGFFYGMKRAGLQYHLFVICIRNDDYPASLEKRKIYLQVPDTEAQEHLHIRVIDESGEDYLYPEDYFKPIELPDEIKQAIIAAA